MTVMQRSSRSAFSPVEVLPPQIERRDIAFSVAGIFDRDPAVIPTGPVPDQRLQPVDRVDYDGLEVVTIGIEGRQSLHHLVKGSGERKARHLQRAEAVLGLDENWFWRRGGKRRLADASDAVDQ